MKLSFFICIFRSYRNFHGHVGNFIWKTYYIALRLCNKIVYASSRNLYARSLKIRKINYFLTWISYIFDGLKFDLGVNNFRCNLNKLLSIASLWTHCWKDTILTSSSDIFCNFYRLCPWLVTMHIYWKYITNGRLKMPFVGILSSTLCALCIESKRNFVNQNKGKISLKIFPWAEWI